MKGSLRRFLSFFMTCAIVLSTAGMILVPLQVYAEEPAVVVSGEEAPAEVPVEEEPAEVPVQEVPAEPSSEEPVSNLPVEEPPSPPVQEEVADDVATVEAEDRLYGAGRNTGPYRLLPAPAPISAGRVTIECDFTSTIDSPNTVIGLVASSAPDTSDTPAMNALVRIDGSNNIDSYNGGGWGSVKIKHVKNTVYHIKTTVDMDAKTYDVWVTPEGGQTTQIATGFAFRSKNPADIGKIGLVDTRDADNATKAMWIENIAVSQDTILKVLLEGEPYLNHGIRFTLNQNGEEKYVGAGANEIVNFGMVANGTYDVYADGVDTEEDIIVSGSGYLEIDMGSEEGRLRKELQNLVDTITQKKLQEEYYTPETWGMFSDKLAAAKEVLAKEEPTAEELKTALDGLQAAYDGLAEKERAHGIYKAAYADYFGGISVRKNVGNTSNGASYSNGSYSDPGDGKGREVVSEFHTGSEAATYKGKPGAGVTFPFTIHEDGEFGFLLRFSRINYEIEDYISVYVNYDQVPKNEDGSPAEPGAYRIPLSGKDSELVFVDSDEWTMNLKKGDKISLVLDTASDVSGAKVDKGLLNLDYISVWEVEDPYIYDTFNRTFYLLLDEDTTNDNIWIPEPDFTADSWISSNPAVATVDSATGEIAPVAPGFAKIIATGTKAGEAAEIPYSIYVKSDESELALRSELVSLWDMEKNLYHPEAKKGSAADVKGFIPIITSGLSTSMEDGSAAVDGVDRAGAG